MRRNNVVLESGERDMMQKTVRISDIVQFITGSRSIPYEIQQIRVEYSEDTGTRPCVQTCQLTLTLPAVKSVNAMADRWTEALANKQFTRR